jgi:uncharacterized protein (TIGR03435 family)
MSILRLLTVAVLPASAILAQDIEGTWQGKLQSGANELRMVYKITRSADGGFAAIFYNLDQSARPIGANSITVQGGSLKITVQAAGGEYQGKLAAGGNTMTGVWNSGGKSAPLALTRATADTAWEIPTVSQRLEPMRREASPAFEVATIKPSGPNESNSGFKLSGRHVYCVRETLRAIMMFAYGIHPRQILEAPAWADTDYYDINGQPDEPGVTNMDQMRGMYRKLLSDRFQLTSRNEKRDLAVFVLSVGKNGPKIARSERGLNASPDQTMNGAGNLAESNATMAEFAWMLQFAVLDRPVLDQTKLEGRFDFLLRWTPDPASGRARPTDNPSPFPDLFTAVQEQLGLKLEATKAPADVLIIEKVGRPSEN